MNEFLLSELLLEAERIIDSVEIKCLCAKEANGSCSLHSRTCLYMAALNFRSLINTRLRGGYNEHGNLKEGNFRISR